MTPTFYRLILVLGCICVIQSLQRTAISQLATDIIHTNGIKILIKLLSLGITAVGPHCNLLAFSSLFSISVSKA